MTEFSCGLNTYRMGEKIFTIVRPGRDDLTLRYKDIRKISLESAGHTRFIRIEFEKTVMSMEMGKNNCIGKLKNSWNLYKERKIEKVKTANKELIARVTKLEGLVEQLLYAPGGPMYQEALERFKSNI